MLSGGSGNKKTPKTNTSWGKVANWYDELLESDADSYQQKVILPNLIRLLAPKAGERVLDLACGSGFFSRVVASMGAEVYATDISAELISLAKGKSTTNIRYYVGRGDSLSFLKEGSIDKAIIVLALQNIKEVRGTLKEVARVLKPFGSLFIVLNHPVLRVPKASVWGFDEEKNVQYRRVDSYLSEASFEIDMNPSKVGGAKTLSFHRSLQFYFKELRTAGFAVGTLEEWISHKKSQKGPRQRAEDNARKEIPLFMCLGAYKLSGLKL